MAARVRGGRGPSRSARLPLALSLSLSTVGPAPCARASRASFAEFDRVLQDVQASASSLVPVDVPGDGNCLFSSIAVSHGFATSGAVPGAAAFAKRARQLRLQANDLLCPGGDPSPEEINGFPIALVMEPNPGEDGCGTLDL